MTFSPVLPSTGLVGWNFLTRTVEAQKEAFSESSSVQRDIDYFESEFPKLNTAEDLVADRRLLNVALGAYGLQDDINNKYFIRRVLEDGTESQSALSNLLADNRYQKFADAFSFPNPAASNTAFTRDITARYVDQSFESAVGDQNPDFRLALNLQRNLGDIATSGLSNDAKWFSVMGSPPLRKVFEVAFRLPASFANLPIDDQLGEFKDRANSVFGSEDISQFADKEAQERIVDQFLLQSQLSSTSALSGQNIALSLLQSSTFSYDV